jgi:hypothetical protein
MGRLSTFSRMISPLTHMKKIATILIQWRRDKSEER